MSARLESAVSTHQYHAASPGSLEAQIAPDIDTKWSEAFIVELRVLDVPGEDIGAALAEVNTHIRESGADVWEAFGEPKDYAASLSFPRVTKQGSSFTQVHFIVIQLVGLWFLTDACGATLTGHLEVPLSTGFLVIILGMYLIAACGKPLLRLLVHHRWIAIAVLAIGSSVAIFAGAYWRSKTLTMPVLYSWIIGGIFMVIGTIMDFLYQRRNPVGDDPISLPIASGSQMEPKRRGFLQWGLIAIIPAATIIICGLLVVINALQN